MGPIKLLYNSKYDFTAKSFVTNSRYNEGPLYCKTLVSAVLKFCDLMKMAYWHNLIFAVLAHQIIKKI